MKLTMFGLITCMTFFLSACSSEKKKEAPPPPPEVSVIETKAEDVPLYLEFVGQTTGLKDIDIRARVEGFLEGVHFQEGTFIEKGKLLYTLESQPFEEKVATRMSEVATVNTMVAKAKGDLDRIRPLAKSNAISKSDLDAAQAAYDASLSSLEAAKATQRASEIELSYTKIKSPIDGIIGKTKAKVGDVVGKNPNPVILNTVSQVDTILVNFFITETQYLSVAESLNKALAKEHGELIADLDLILNNGSVFEHKGRPDFIDREIDTSTGSILVQASFPNPQQILRPGQFAKIRVESEVVKDAILVPQRSVMEIQGLHNVFVVNADNTVENRSVTVGDKVGSSWLVTEGLKPGEKVIYEGLQKAKDGAVVTPVAADIKPTEQDSKATELEANSTEQDKK